MANPLDAVISDLAAKEAALRTSADSLIALHAAGASPEQLAKLTDIATGVQSVIDAINGAVTPPVVAPPTA